MSLDSILEKIGQQAQSDRDRILNESRERADKVKAEAEQETKAQAELLFKTTAQEADLEAHRLITQARLQKKLQILSLKKSLVGEVLDSAFAQLDPKAISVKKQIISKEGVREESLDQATLKQELRPQLENYIADLLKI
jgi:vacuolar-type H+-ATPase subunit E/Vma4